MKATDVYNIAIALSSDELNRLYDMLGAKVCSTKRVLSKKRKRLPNFTVEDGLQLLMENHFNRIKKQ